MGKIKKLYIAPSVSVIKGVRYVDAGCYSLVKSQCISSVSHPYYDCYNGHIDGHIGEGYSKSLEMYNPCVKAPTHK